VRFCGCSSGYCSMCYSIPSAATAAACTLRLLYSSHSSCLHASILASSTAQQPAAAVELAEDFSSLSLSGCGSSAAQLLLLFVCFVEFHKGCTTNWLLQCKAVCAEHSVLGRCVTATPVPHSSSISAAAWSWWASDVTLATMRAKMCLAQADAGSCHSCAALSPPASSSGGHTRL
jgi:hypothetical protein